MRLGMRVPWGDLGAWVLAFAVAIGLWLFVNTGERLSERTLRVRLEPENLPAGLVVANPVAEFVEVRVNGPGIILSAIDPKRMRTPLDLSGVRPGIATYAINPKMFQLPRKVEVIRVTPAQVSLQVDRIARRLLPVRLDRVGEPPPGYEVTDVRLTPEKIEVSGPATKLEGLRAVVTEPIDMATVASSGGREILRLIQPANEEAIELNPAEILAEIQMAPLSAEREIKGVAVEVRGGRGFRVDPPRIDVVVRGARGIVEGLELRPGSVYVEVGGLGAGSSRMAKPHVTLPDGVELLRRSPAEVKVVGPPAKPGRTRARRSESRS